MYIHPSVGSQLGREKQRDMIAQAHRLSEARRARGLTRVSRSTTWANRLPLRHLKRRRTAALAPDPVPARSELETATVTSPR
jgi:hypothetical protein